MLAPAQHDYESQRANGTFVFAPCSLCPDTVNKVASRQKVQLGCIKLQRSNPQCGKGGRPLLVCALSYTHNLVGTKVTEVAEV